MKIAVKNQGLIAAQKKLRKSGRSELAEELQMLQASAPELVPGVLCRLGLGAEVGAPKSTHEKPVQPAEIAAQMAAAPRGRPGQMHVVQSGDTISGILKRNGISPTKANIARFVAENRGVWQSAGKPVNADLIYPGMKFKLPRGAQQPTQAGSALASIPSSGPLSNDAETLLKQMRHISQRRGRGDAAVARYLAPAMNAAGITTPKRRAAFLAQLSHESAGFQARSERAPRGRNARDYFNRKYSHRANLGNRGGDDGFNFRGRGLIQLTGRANCAAAGRALGVDLVNNPDLAGQPKYAAQIATWYWSSRNLNRYADRGQYGVITKRINGGYNGAADRNRLLQRATAVV